ncbi:MAG: molybdenum cofactor biosynthesis protein, partial [Gammaproteobacteria bacterium]|nr:molybdenum cofactor biosynthesis protein [Gammaproteobacteria bacterium]
MSQERSFIPLKICVLTVSDSRSEADDVSGKVLRDALIDAGHTCYEKTIVRDDKYEIRDVISGWIRDPEVNAVLTTGGTGITGRDVTPEALERIRNEGGGKDIPGFGELFRWLSFRSIG